MADDARFRAAHKLGGVDGFAGVFANRKVLRGALFDLHFRLNAIDTARLGVVIPKRNARRAVLRNRFKRLAREVFRRQRQGLPNVDLVLRLARSADSVEVNNTIVRGDIQNLVSRLLADTVR
jgi:ribonuclease P protein component